MVPCPLASIEYVPPEMTSTRSKNPGAVNSSTPPVMFPFPSATMLAAHTLAPWVPVAAVKNKAYRPFKLPFNDVPVIMTDALALFALSVMELAMMTTCPPAGAAEGAVYVVLVPLAVETGLKEPQVTLGVQLQLTPALAASLETVAATLAVPPAGSEEGGTVVIMTMMDVDPGC